MTHFDYDLFVIGAGSGGVRSARLAAQAGWKVAVAEEHKPGGTCVIRGCVPKKYMVYASQFGKAFKGAKGYGWSADNVRFDWATFRDAMLNEVERLSGIYTRNLGGAGVELINARATMKDAHTLILHPEGREVTAKHILIAVGGYPFKPEDLEGVEHAITSNEVFHLETLPKSLVIAGGGYIACEFAHVFAGLGVDVSLVYRGDKVLRGFDEDVRDHIHAALERSGVKLITNTVFAKLEKDSDSVINAHLTNGDVLRADQVVLAIGRVPYTAGLGLEAAGVALDGAGAVKVDAYSKTNIDNIYAVGDVTNRVNLTPVAIREGVCFVETLVHGRPTAYDHSDIASAVFTQPPVGSVGLSESDAVAQHGEVEVYKTDFRPMKNVLSGEQSRMMMKLVVKADDQRVIGVHIVGDDAPEIIQAVGIAVKAGLTKAQFDATCAVHPTVAEELVTLKDKYVPNKG
ncbi:glutathione-disulfide reductase [Woodsholea maritima]|uniref:glutathione-disulfide reductase n=1 Tax=Woodsholea maritima TaxID=240237 RepID=UPI00035D1DB1|nr:glutathione-disulfide reductase [Woodsholea maritima]